MRDVVEERVAGAHRVGEADRRRGISLDQHVVGGSGQAVGAHHHHLREAVRAGDEVAVGVGREQRDIPHVGVGELDAEEFGGMRLHDGPGFHAAGQHVVRGKELSVAARRAVFQELAGRDRLARGVELIRAQEHLMRGM